MNSESPQLSHMYVGGWKSELIVIPFRGRLMFHIVVNLL